MLLGPIGSGWSRGRLHRRLQLPRRQPRRQLGGHPQCLLQALHACWGSESALWCLAQAGSFMMLLVQPRRVQILKRCVWRRVWPAEALGYLECCPAAQQSIVWFSQPHVGLSVMLFAKHTPLAQPCINPLRKGLPARVSTALCRQESRRATRKHRRDGPWDIDVHSDPEALLRAGRAALATAAAAEGQAAKRHKAGLGPAVRFAEAVEVIIDDGQTEEQGATADRAAGEVKRPKAVSINRVRRPPAGGSGKHMDSSVVVVDHCFCLEALGLCRPSVHVQRLHMQRSVPRQQPCFLGHCKCGADCAPHPTQGLLQLPPMRMLT